MPFLSDLISAKRSAQEGDGKATSEEWFQAMHYCSPCVPFRAALVEARAPALIAEVKHRSPSSGEDLMGRRAPWMVTDDYVRGGAAAISVVTEPDHFGGSWRDLTSARIHHRETPLLRKDFLLTEQEVVQSRLMGADAVLLIVAALDPDELYYLIGVAHAVGMDALVEVHTYQELLVALDVGADLVGVNQRNLETLEFEPDRFGLGLSIPDGVVAVLESGMRNRGDVLRAGARGFDAVLVGTGLLQHQFGTRGGTEVMSGMRIMQH